MHTGSGGGNFACGWKAIKWRIVTVHHNRVHRIGLLEFIKQLLHGLNSVVTTQIDHHLL